MIRRRSIVAAALVVVVVVTAPLVWLAAAPSGNEDRLTPTQIDANFWEGAGRKLEPGRFEPSISQQEAETIAVDKLLGGWGLPTDEGLGKHIEVKSTTGLYTGAGEFSQPDNLEDPSTWEYQKMPVWVVVLSDIPVTIPYGKPGTTADSSEVPPPELTMAINAETGEVMDGQMNGAGSMSPKWDDILDDLPEQDEGEIPATPTPAPAP